MQFKLSKFVCADPSQWVKSSTKLEVAGTYIMTWYLVMVSPPFGGSAQEMRTLVNTETVLGISQVSGMYDALMIVTSENAP